MIVDAVSQFGLTFIFLDILYQKSKYQFYNYPSFFHVFDYLKILKVKVLVKKYSKVLIVSDLNELLVHRN